MEGMAIFGAIVGGLALLGIVLAYAWGEAKTPGWGWKKQVENPNATTQQEFDEATHESSTGQVNARGPVAGGTTQPPTATSVDEEMRQAAQDASRERETSNR